MRAKLGCSAGPQGREMSWLRNLRTRLKTLWMTFMTGAALSVRRPLGSKSRAAGGCAQTQAAAPSAHASPEDRLVQVLGMGALDVLQVTHHGQPGPELTPGDVQDLVGDVALGDLHKVLHLMLEQLQLAELHGASCGAHQGCGEGRGEG